MAQNVKMEILQPTNGRFSISTGHKAVPPMLPAMPIDVRYLLVERDCSLEWPEGKAQFRMRIPERHSPASGFQYWDVFSVRDSFEGLNSPEDAFRFLSASGSFRYRRDKFQRGEDVLSWSELQGWQKLLLKIRRRDLSEGFPLIGIQEPGAKHLFLESDFWTDEGEEFIEAVWRVSRETFHWLHGIPEGLAIRRDMYLSKEETRAIFAEPGAMVRGSLAWHGAYKRLQHQRAKRARGNTEGKQKLIAEIHPTCTLNAILATIYVEKLRGIDVQVCALKECNETFPVESDHGKMYCSNYHAHLASLRRKRAELKAKRQGKARRGKGKKQ